MAAEETDKSYSLEPRPEPDPERPAEAERAPEGAAAPVPDAPHGPDQAESVHDLDVCPNCGATMRGSDELLCLRCGFDLKTMQVIETKKGEVSEIDPEEGPAPVVGPGHCYAWVPLALAGAGAFVLLVGTLAGAHGLFRTSTPEEAVGWPARLLGLVREPVVILVGVLCVLGGLMAGARMWSRPVGDLGVAARRVLGIVVVARLAAFLDFRWLALELTVEIILQAGVVFAGMLVLFALTPKQSATVLGASVTAIFTIYVTAQLVTWAL